MRRINVVIVFSGLILLSVIILMITGHKQLTTIEIKQSSQAKYPPNNVIPVVCLAPLGSFDSTLLDSLKKEVADFYQVHCLLCNAMPLPSNAWYSPRKRYRADVILDHLCNTKPVSIDYVVGLTMSDISTTKGNIPDWGVFGLGYMPGNCCVISTYRLKSSAKSDGNFLERLSKVVLHELGHNFGLPHCETSGCIMQDAEGTIRTVDKESKNLCKQCKILLYQTRHSANY